MNTTTATRRNALLRQQGITPPARLTADRPAAALPPAPAHDFLVLNQHPAFTAEAAPCRVPAIPAKAWTV